MQLLTVCMCRVEPCRQAYFYHVLPVEKQCMQGRVIMNKVSVVAAAGMSSTGSTWHEKDVRSVKLDEVRNTLVHLSRIGPVLSGVPPCLLDAAQLPNPGSRPQATTCRAGWLA